MIKLLTRLRNYLISGLLFWIPLILTIIVIKFFLEFINSLVPQEYLPEAIFNLDTFYTRVWNNPAIFNYTYHRYISY